MFYFNNDDEEEEGEESRQNTNEDDSDEGRYERLFKSLIAASKYSDLRKSKLQELFFNPETFLFCRSIFPC